MNETNKLRKLRYGAELSLKELSSGCGIALSVLCYLENGERPFRQAHIDRLCAFFDVSSDYLLGKSDSWIGVHFIPSEGEACEYRKIKESELDGLASEGALRTCVRVSATGGMGITDGGSVVPGMPLHVVREAEMGSLPYDKASALRDEIESEVRSMGERELEKTLRFIREYIK